MLRKGRGDKEVRTSRFPYLYLSASAPIRLAPVPCKLDFLKSPSSCLFTTPGTKDFSCLIAANFSDPKTGRCASTNQGSPGYPLGTELFVPPFSASMDFLDDSKLSLTSRIFRTTVLFLSVQFQHKKFVKSEPSPLDISFLAIISRFKQALVFFGHRISSIFVQNLCS